MKRYSRMGEKRTGDKGETSLTNGKRVSKHSLQIHARGTCDEANAMLGLAAALLDKGESWNDVRRLIQSVQTKLVHVGAELSTPPRLRASASISEEDVREIELRIADMGASLPPEPLRLLPGGHPCGAALHAARTIVRRTERLAVEIWRTDDLNPAILAYLNRLSDLLFVAARAVNLRKEMPE